MDTDRHGFFAEGKEVNEGQKFTMRQRERQRKGQGNLRFTIYDLRILTTDGPSATEAATKEDGR